MNGPGELIDEALAVSRAMQFRIDGQDALTDQAHDLEEIAALAEANAFLATDKSQTIPERQAHVVKATHAERRNANLAKDRARDNDRAVKGMMARLSVLQSALSVMREEARLSRIGDGP